jgi:divalent metal cation (Fe/Co/Zn/Cd) transporter
MALGGIVAARAGFAALDPVAGILVTAMIGLTGMQIFLDSIRQLTDTAEQETIPGIRRVAEAVEGVRETSDVRARRMGPQLLVDLRIQVDSQISASAAQQVCTCMCVSCEYVN